MACKVTTVKAPNGKESNVYKNIAGRYGAEVGLAALLHLHSNDYISKHGNWKAGEGGNLDDNGEPNWNKVLVSMLDHKSIDSIYNKVYKLTSKKGKPYLFSEAEAKAKVEDVNKKLSDKKLPAQASMSISSDGKYEVSINAITPTEGFNDLDLDVSSGFEDDMNFQMNDSFNVDADFDNNGLNMDTVFDDETISRFDSIHDDFHSIDDGFDFDVFDSYYDSLMGGGKKKARFSDIKNHKYKKVIDQLQLRNKNLDRQILNAEKKLEKAYKKGDTDEITRLKKSMAKKRVEINTNRDKIKDVLLSDNIDATIAIMKADISTIKRELFTNNNLTTQEIENFRQILDFWAAAADFSNPEHLFLDYYEASSKLIQDKFKDLARQAEALMPSIANKLHTETEKFVQDTIGIDWNVKEAKQLAEDIGWLASQSFHIGRTDNALLQAIYKKVRKTNLAASNEIKSIHKKIDDVLDNIKDYLKQNTEDPFAIFRQKTKDGKNTGDMVTMFSAEYDLAKQKYFWDVLNNPNSTKAQREAAYKWQAENEILFDARKLFLDSPYNLTKLVGGSEKFTEEDREAHIAEMKRHVGEEMFDRMKKEFDKRMAQFELDAEAAKDLILNDPELSDKQKDAKWDYWLKNNSPFYAAKAINDFYVNKSEGQFIAPHGRRYSITVPRRYKASKNKKYGSDAVKEIEPQDATGWYDKTFDSIRQDPNLLEFWTMYTDLMQDLNNAIPANKRKRIKNNSVIATKLTIRELYGKESTKVAGVGAMSAAFLDNVVQSLREDNVTNTDQLDPTNNKKIRYVSDSFVRDNKEKLNSNLKKKVINYQAKHGKEPDDDTLIQMRAETLDELAGEKSFDLGKVLKNYASNAIMFKHKSSIEDQVFLAARIMQEAETSTNKLDGNTKESKAVDNYQKMLDHYLDHFDGSPTKEHGFGKMKDDIYTTAEKKKLAEIDEAIKETEELIANGTFDEQYGNELIKQFQTERIALGGKVTGSGAVDNVLKFTQLKTMGFNATAAVANFGVGQLANINEAARGRFFKESSFWKAMYKTLYAYTIGWATEDGKKIRDIVEKWDLLQTNLDDADSTISSWAGRNLTFNSITYAFGNWAEKLNQTPIALAKMIDTEITVNGKTTNLLDALDVNGRLKQEWTTPETDAQWNQDGVSNAKTQFQLEAQEAIISIHGNYNTDAPVLYKRKAEGRALGQLKGWLPELAAGMFEKEYDDHLLNIKRKGKLRSLLASKNNEGEYLSYIDQLKEVLRVFTGRLADPLSFATGWTVQQGKLSEVDYQNLKSVSTQIQTLAAFAFLYMALSAGAEDADEEDKWWYNVGANLSLKIFKDSFSLYNPGTVESLSGNTLPSMSLLTDLGELGNAILKTYIGDNPYISSGINAGRHRVSKEVWEMTPIINQWNKLDTFGDKLITNPNDLSEGLLAEARDWIYGLED